MAGFKLLFDDAYDEVQQRILAVTQASPAVNTGKWTQAAIVRRMNIKHGVWLSWLQGLDPQYGTKRATLTVSAIDPTENEYLVACPSDFRSAWRLYKKEDDGRLVPVTLIAPRDEARYNVSTTGVMRGDSTFRTYEGYIEGLEDGTSQIWFVRSSSGSGDHYIGNYQLRYYFQAPAMTYGGGDQSLLPPELDEIWIDDTVASLLSDGNPKLMAALGAQIQLKVAEFRALYKKTDSARTPRIKDVMGYGSVPNLFWRL